MNTWEDKGFKFTVVWTFVDEEDDCAEEYDESAEAEFNTLDECRQWLGDRINDYRYDCLCFNNETGRIAFTGYLP